MNTALAPDVAPPRPRATAAHPVTQPYRPAGAPGRGHLWVVSVVIFAATVALPGNAATAILGSLGDPGGSCTPWKRNCTSTGRYSISTAPGSAESSPAIRESLANGMPVWSIVGPAALNSAVLVAVSGIIAQHRRSDAGCGGGLRKDSLFDHASSVLALAVTSLPEFVVAITLIILFATVVWHVLPAVSLLAPGTYAWASPRELILPVATLVIVTVPYIFRMTRAAMVEALASDYVEMARLKGLPTRRVLAVHALPNAVAPVVQVIGLSFLYLAGGIVVVEFVFAFPGIGQSLVNAVTNRDVPVIQMIVLLLAGFYVVRQHRRRTSWPCWPPRAAGCPGRAMAAAPTHRSARPRSRRRRGGRSILRRAASLPRGRFGLAAVGVVVAVAVVGPFVAPHSATASIVAPRSPSPSRSALLGGDELGRDVLSRVLDGGWVLLAMAAAATALGVARRERQRRSRRLPAGRWDGIIMRTVDVILAFPQLVFALLLVSILGPTVWLTVLAVGLSHAPQVARVMRSAALDVSERDFVKAVELLGVKRRKIMAKEILPNLISPLMVESGLRLTYSIVIIAGLSFLGFGQPPPAPNWGIMINENRIGLVLNPWAVIVPARR